MKRISTIRLLTELSKFGELTIQGRDPSVNQGKRFYCNYEPNEDYKPECDFVNLGQSTDDILSFLRIAASCFEYEFNPIFDKIIDSLI